MVNDRALTPREVESLRLAAAGLQSREIAKLWGNRYPANVRRMWKNAMDKLGADTTCQAVAMAIRQGLID
jgi:DNA-binding CsgD family transcriptional regulator